MDKFKNENMKSENEIAKQFKKWKLKTKLKKLISTSDSFNSKIPKQIAKLLQKKVKGGGRKTQQKKRQKIKRQKKNECLKSYFGELLQRAF